MGTRTKLMIGMMIGLAAAHCGSSDTSTSTTSNVSGTGTDAATATQAQTVDILSNWSGPGPAEGLQRLLSLYKTKYPDDQVINSAFTTMDLAGLLQERVNAGNPPDIFVQHSSELAEFIQTNGVDSLLAMNDFMASPAGNAIPANTSPELMEECSYQGKVYGVPVGFVVRGDILLYNARVFQEHDLTPPNTVDEFLSVCKAFKAANISCLTTSFMTVLFEEMLAGSMGIDAYYTYRRTGQVDPAALSKGIDLFVDVIDNYLDPSALSTDDTQEAAVGGLMSGKIAMYANGDWVKPMFEQLGWTPEVDFGILPGPGGAGLFVYSADVFTVPGNASHPQGALRFLTVNTSVEGQIAFGGTNATPVRSDVQLPVDAQRQRIIQDWRQATHRLAANPKFIWEGPLQGFVHSTPRDKQALVQTLQLLY